MPVLHARRQGRPANPTSQPSANAAPCRASNPVTCVCRLPGGVHTHVTWIGEITNPRLGPRTWLARQAGHGEVEWGAIRGLQRAALGSHGEGGHGPVGLVGRHAAKAQRLVHRQRALRQRPALQVSHCAGRAVCMCVCGAGGVCVGGWVGGKRGSQLCGSSRSWDALPLEAEPWCNAINQLQVGCKHLAPQLLLASRGAPHIGSRAARARGVHCHPPPVQHPAPNPTPRKTYHKAHGLRFNPGPPTPCASLHPTALHTSRSPVPWPWPCPPKPPETSL